MAKVLVVDEDPVSVADLTARLCAKGFRVAPSSGRQALARYPMERPDAVVLERDLEGQDPFDLCRSLREQPDPPGRELALLFFARRDDSDGRRAAFESGADDFVAKGTAWEEFVVRLRAHLRRAKGRVGEVVVAGEVQIDRARHRVLLRGQPVALTLTEYNLLELFVRNRNVALTREQILRAVWGGNGGEFTNIVDVYVNYLRKKLEAGERGRMLKTVRGVGYMLEVDAAP